MVFRDPLQRDAGMEGGIAQLVERLLRMQKARSSNLLTSIMEFFFPNGLMAGKLVGAEW